QPAGAGVEAWRHRAVRATGRGGLARSLNRAGANAGASCDENRQRSAGMAIRMTHRMTRRDFAALAGGILLSTKAVAQTETQLLTRSLPRGRKSTTLNS